MRRDDWDYPKPFSLPAFKAALLWAALAVAFVAALAVTVAPR